MSAPVYAVANRRAPGSKRRFLRSCSTGPDWTDDSTKADRMTRDKAERLADDWNCYAASKGFDWRAYAHLL